MDSISGCAGGGSITANCVRAGGLLITITGDMLGQSNALILVGGAQCQNVLHDAVTPQQKLTCQYPSGTDLNQAVLLAQAQGQITQTPLFLSYVQCEIR